MLQITPALRILLLWRPSSPIQPPALKVLLCVNAPGVQQPLEGLAGVILVRQSSLMSTFKQMLCRALVAAGSRSVPVFDLVAQFEGLGERPYLAA